MLESPCYPAGSSLPWLQFLVFLGQGDTEVSNGPWMTLMSLFWDLLPHPLPVALGAPFRLTPGVSILVMLAISLVVFRVSLYSAMDFLGLLSHLWADIPVWTSLGISVLHLSVVTITRPGPDLHFQLGPGPAGQPGLAWWPGLLVERGCHPWAALLSSLSQHKAGDCCWGACPGCAGSAWLPLP